MKRKTTSETHSNEPPLKKKKIDFQDKLKECYETVRKVSKQVDQQLCGKSYLESWSSYEIMMQLRDEVCELNEKISRFCEMIPMDRLSMKSLMQTESVNDILGSVFSFLNLRQLFKMRLVSRDWKEICDSHPLAISSFVLSKEENERSIMVFKKRFWHCYHNLSTVHLRNMELIHWLTKNEIVFQECKKLKSTSVNPEMIQALGKIVPKVTTLVLQPAQYAIGKPIPMSLFQKTFPKLREIYCNRIYLDSGTQMFPTLERISLHIANPQQLVRLFTLCPNLKSSYLTVHEDFKIDKDLNLSGPKLESLQIQTPTVEVLKILDQFTNLKNLNVRVPPDFEIPKDIYQKMGQLKCKEFNILCDYLPKLILQSPLMENVRSLGMSIWDNDPILSSEIVQQRIQELHIQGSFESNGDYLDRFLNLKVLTMAISEKLENYDFSELKSLRILRIEHMKSKCHNLKVDNPNVRDIMIGGSIINCHIKCKRLKKFSAQRCGRLTRLKIKAPKLKELLLPSLPLLSTLKVEGNVPRLYGLHLKNLSTLKLRMYHLDRLDCTTSFLTLLFESKKSNLDVLSSSIQYLKLCGDHKILSTSKFMKLLDHFTNLKTLELVNMTTKMKKSHSDLETKQSLRTLIVSNCKIPFYLFSLKYPNVDKLFLYASSWKKDDKLDLMDEDSWVHLNTLLIQECAAIDSPFIQEVIDLRIGSLKQLVVLTKQQASQVGGVLYGGTRTTNLTCYSSYETPYTIPSSENLEVLMIEGCVKIKNPLPKLTNLYLGRVQSKVPKQFSIRGLRNQFKNLRNKVQCANLKNIKFGMIVSKKIKFHKYLDMLKDMENIQNVIAVTDGEVTYNDFERPKGYDIILTRDSGAPYQAFCV